MECHVGFEVINLPSFTKVAAGPITSVAPLFRPQMLLFNVIFHLREEERRGIEFGKGKEERKRRFGTSTVE